MNSIASSHNDEGLVSLTSKSAPNGSTAGSNGKVLAAFDELIRGLIGTSIGISPEEVTTEFIHLWREERLYPTAPVESATNGYSAVGCRALTGEEVVAQSDRAKAFFGKLANGKKLS